VRIMLTVSDDLFTVLAGAILLARRAPNMLRAQLEGGINGVDGLPPEVAEKLVGWASTVQPAAFNDDAITPETEAGGAAYFDQRAAEALVAIMSAGGDPTALIERLKESGRAP